MLNKKLYKFLIFSLLLIFLNACGKDFFKYSSAKDNPTRGIDRAKKNVKEGRGINLSGLTGKGKTTYEFSTSNPLWRASLDILDFIPMATVDYSGGTIVSDWYTDGSRNNESIKITVRFLSNEIRSDSMKIILHKKICDNELRCSTNLVKSSIIKDELRSTILRKASLFQKADKEKK